MSWVFALLGLATTIAGGGAIAVGWPLVPLERGWTMVIAGAALVSGGLVCLALAALMSETRRTRLAVERGLARLASGPIEAEAVEIASTSLSGHERMSIPATAPAGASAAASRATHGEVALGSEQEAAPVEMRPARSFTVGDTTFVVFTDGSIEARSSEGTERFQSMEEVRAYLEGSRA